MNPLLQALIESPSGEPSASPAQETVSLPAASPLARPAAPPAKVVRYEHRAMAKMIAANPTISQGELARIFGYSPSWISTLMHSDAFQGILFEEMEKSDFPAEVRAQHKLQIQGILSRSMDILREKLDKPADQVPDQLALQVFKSSATSLGMGVRDVKVQISETHNHLNELSENLVGLLRQRKREAIEGSIEEVPRGQEELDQEVDQAPRRSSPSNTYAAGQEDSAQEDRAGRALPQSAHSPRGV